MEIKKRFSLAGFCLIGIIIFGVAIQQIGLVMFPEIQKSVFLTLVVNYLGMYGLGLPIFMLVLKKYPQSELRAKNQVSLKEWGTLVLMGLGIMYFVNLTFALLMQLISGSNGNLLGDIVSGFKLWQIFILVVLIGPSLEELVFRKLLYRVASPLGNKGYILFSSIVFGLYHMNISQTIYAFFLGLVLSYLYVRTGSLKLSIITHIVINFIGSFIPMLVTSSVILTGIFGFGVLIVMVLGLITLFRNKKNIQQYFNEAGDSIDINWKSVFVNPGMIALVLLCIGMMITTFIMQLK